MKNKGTFKKKLPIIGLVAVCVLGAAVGGVAGWLTGAYSKPRAEIEGEEIEIDNELYASFLDFVDENGGDLEAIDLTETLDEFSVPNLMSIAYYKFCFMNENSTFYSYGKAESIALFITNNQITGTARYKRGDKILKENTSQASTVEFSDRIYNYNVNSEESEPYEDQYDLYHCSSLSDGSTFEDDLKYSAPFEDVEVQQFTKEDFISKYSLNPDYCSNFEFEDDSVVYDEVIEASSLLHDDTTYEYETGISLNASNNYEINIVFDESGYESYKNFMPTTTEGNDLAEMKEAPTFDYIGATYILDRNLNLLSGRVSESYTVHAIMNVPTTAESIYMYDYETSTEIPDLSTMSDFANTIGEKL